MSILNGAGENEVMRRAIAVPELRAVFLRTLEVCARSAAANNWMADTLAKFSSLIDTAAREDTRKRFTNDEFDAHLEYLRRFAAVRPQFVLQEVAALRSSSAGTLP